MIEILVRLGWIINLKKSDLVPSQDLVFLGSRFNTRLGIVSLSAPRITNMEGITRWFLSRPSVTARDYLRLLGHMASTVDVVWRARLRMRPIQLALAQQWDHSQDLDSLLHIPEWLPSHLQWWIQAGHLSRGLPLKAPVPTLSIQTDASLTGWGGVLNHLSVQGRWSIPETQLHINVLELRAVRLVFEKFRDVVQGQVVRLEMDNQTALTYIQKQGGTVSPTLLSEAWQFLHWCDRYNITVVPVYLPGLENVRADALSRRILAPHEWKLDPEVFRTISQLYGPFQVDLFASGATYQIPVFCSRIPDLKALASDAFQLNWTDRVLWAFPPLPLIHKVLAQLSIQPARLLVLLAPLWPSQSWFPVVLRSLCFPPLLLPVRSDLLMQNGACHWNPRIQWVAWPLSGLTSKTEAFLQQLQTQFWLRGGIRQTFSMRIDGPVMSAGVAIGEFQIPFLRM
jgi:hypothetical protein